MATLITFVEIGSPIRIPGNHASNKQSTLYVRSGVGFVQATCMRINFDWVVDLHESKFCIKEKKKLYPTLSLLIQVYQWVPAGGGGDNLAME